MNYSRRSVNLLSIIESSKFPEYNFFIITLNKFSFVIRSKACSEPFQPTLIWSRLTIETLQQGGKYVQS